MSALFDPPACVDEFRMNLGPVASCFLGGTWQWTYLTDSGVTRNMSIYMEFFVFWYTLSIDMLTVRCSAVKSCLGCNAAVGCLMSRISEALLLCGRAEAALEYVSERAMEVRSHFTSLLRLKGSFWTDVRNTRGSLLDLVV